MRGSRCAALLGLALGAGMARADVFPSDAVITAPTPQLFSVCHGGGCKEVTPVSLDAAQWRRVKAVFEPPPRDAAEERERLRPAIALMEQLAGAASGTSQDRGGTFNFGPGQMDCIDESVNTTLYLTLFRAQGLLRFHDVQDRVTRGWFIHGWPHTTAVIRDRGDGSRWAVDSWFLDNGQPPFVVPLSEWKSGWRPPGK